MAFFYVSFESVQAQNLIANKPKESVKLGRILSIHLPEELSADADAYYKEFGGGFAVRLCSTEFLPIAYGLSAERLKAFPRDLSRLLSIPKKNISLFVYKKNCASGDEETTAVELWWTPDGGKTIEFDKQFVDCQFERGYYGKVTGKGFRNDKQYATALKKLKKEIRAVSNGSKRAGLVRVVYYNQYTERLRRRIEQAKAFLADEVNDKLITFRVDETYIPYISEKAKAKLKEKEYPDVFSVQFEENGCSQ